MKTSTRIPDPAAEEQASLWAARLEGGTLEARDRQELDAWLAESPAHRVLLSEYCQFSADLEQQLPALVASGAVAMPAPAEAPRRRWSLGWLSLGMGGLAAATAAFVLWTGQPGTQPEKYSTPIAQRQTLKLSDGTEVELNAQSSLVVENSRDERRVRLTSGEAFFTVAKDKSRPFIVETPTGSVRVTGTVFDVRTDKGELDVAVVEGSVQVRPSDAVAGGAPVPPSSLTANMRLVADGKLTVRTLAEGSIDDLLAWRQGQMVFDNVPLRDALAKIARYHGKDVTLSAAVVASDKTVGARYAIDDFNSVINGLATTFGLRVTRDVNTGGFYVTLLSEK